MDAIRKLQEQLQAAQKVSNARKISERNCVDLLAKLIDTEQVKLFHTTSGKEWLTPEQLDREIRDVLAANGGRLSITELPNELGVGVEACETRSDLICRKDGSISRMHGELLSTQYVQSVAQEIEESLEEAGCIQVSELATRYNLPAEFVRESVLGKVSTDHVVKQNSIYTGAHAARIEARVRGALRGCTQPVTIPQLAARHRFEDVDLVATLAQKLVREGFAPGKLQGSTFTPKVFADAQSARVDEFFNANQFLPLALAKSAGISVKDWAQAKGIDGMTLNTAFVASPLVDSALAPISEAVSSESWTDVQAQLPPALTIADARELLLQLSQKKKLPQNALVIDRLVISRQFLKKVTGSFEVEVKAAAEQKLAAEKKAGGGKKGGAAVPADADDDGDTVGSKKKSKSVKSKGKKAGRGDDEEDATCGTSGSTGIAADSGLDNDKISELLEDKYPELPADLFDEIIEQLQPSLVAMVNEELTSLRATLQTKRKSLFEVSEKLVQERYERLVLGFRALEATKLLETPLYQYLLRETVAEPLNALLALRWEEVSGNSVEVTAATRKQVLDKIVAKEGATKAESLTKLLSVFGGKVTKDTKESKEASKAKNAKDKGSKDKKKKGKGDDDEEEEAEEAGDVTDLYHAAANDCHIYCRKVDKKRQKDVLQEQKVSCKERMRGTPASDLVQACSVGLQLACLQDGTAGLLCPAEPWALRLVASKLANEALQEDALALCDAMEAVAATADGSPGAGEKKSSLAEDPVKLEAATAAWREKFLK